MPLGGKAYEIGSPNKHVSTGPTINCQRVRQQEVMQRAEEKQDKNLYGLPPTYQS
jgi:hypothetical protein